MASPSGKYIKAQMANPLKEIPRELPPDPAWLEERRGRAREQARELENPSDPEEWKYTQLKALGIEPADPASERATQEFSISWKQVEQKIEKQTQSAVSWGATMAFVEGRFLHEEKTPLLSHQRVVIRNLKNAIHEHGDIIREALQGDLSWPDKYTAWNEAYWQDGLFLYVPPHTHVELPLRALWVRSGNNACLFPKTLIICERSSICSFVEEYQTILDGTKQEVLTPLSASRVHIVLKEGAEFHYLNFQNWDHDTFHRLYQTAVLSKDAKFYGTALSAGSRAAKNTIFVKLEGPGAESRLTGLVFARGHQHVDHHAGQIHISPNATSNLLFKSALQDHARTIFTGLIRVDPKAQKTDAYQSSRNLLLSPKARADAIPKLEIEANDVRCTHGTTLGSLDSEQLFYLMSRGLGQQEAKQLIVHGFFAEALSRLSHKDLRQHSEELVEGILEKEWFR